MPPQNTKYKSAKMTSRKWRLSATPCNACSVTQWPACCNGYMAFRNADSYLHYVDFTSSFCPFLSSILLLPKHPIVTRNLSADYVQDLAGGPA